MPALAEAGFHVLAPDMRGYGETDCPPDIEKYTLLHLVGDMVGLLDSFSAENAVIAGHDWGAPVAWHARKIQSVGYTGPITLSAYQRFSWIREQLEKEGFNIPMPSGN